MWCRNEWDRRVSIIERGIYFALTLPENFLHFDPFPTVVAVDVRSFEVGQGVAEFHLKKNL